MAETQTAHHIMHVCECARSWRSIRPMTLYHSWCVFYSRIYLKATRKQSIESYRIFVRHGQLPFYSILLTVYAIWANDFRQSALSNKNNNNRLRVHKLTSHIWAHSKMHSNCTKGNSNNKCNKNIVHCIEAREKKAVMHATVTMNSISVGKYSISTFKNMAKNEWEKNTTMENSSRNSASAERKRMRGAVNRWKTRQFLCIESKLKIRSDHLICVVHFQLQGNHIPVEWSRSHAMASKEFWSFVAVVVFVFVFVEWWVERMHSYANLRH